MKMKKVNYMLEIDILRNSSQKFWVSWGVLFKGLGVQNDTQTPCWLRPWLNRPLNDRSLRIYFYINN